MHIRVFTRGVPLISLQIKGSYIVTLIEGNTYIGLLVEESITLLDWGNMVERETEAKSSGIGVTNPYRRTEHCDKIHAYRCDKEVGVDVSKEQLAGGG
jgi:hypothetical protein